MKTYFLKPRMTHPTQPSPTPANDPDRLKLVKATGE
jgi:hypothetical protein